MPGLAPVDGKYIYGDLILMKIPRRQYDGALLHHELLARKRANITNIAASTRGEIHTGPRDRDKIVTEVPGNPDQFLTQRDREAGVIPIGPKKDS